MAATGIIAFLILLVVENEILHQLCSYIWNFILRPIKTVEKVQIGSEGDSSHSESGDSKDDLNCTHVIGDGGRPDLILPKPKSNQNDEHEVFMQKISKYFGRRAVVDRISFNIKR